ncbi:basic membrane lipoprotein, partial [gut metagenome]
VLALTMGLSLVACGGAPASESTSNPADTSEVSSEASQPSASGTDVAFITDVGNIDDNSFNQFTYEGVTKFCEDNGLKANYFRPAEDTDEARMKAMSQAIDDGAKAVVMAGFLFAPTLRQAQEKWPDVQFLALDVSSFDMKDVDEKGNPVGDPVITDNTSLITYKEEQPGYLAGYAAVADGYKNLGFLGGVAVPAVVRYGQGLCSGR